MSSRYQVLLVDTSGVPLALLENATVESVGWELNGFGGATITLPMSDPKALLVQPLAPEVQIWRDGACIFWGPPVRFRGDAGKLTVQCLGPLWYFSREHTGPNTIEFASNGNFEDGLTDWSASGGDVTASVSTTIVAEGAKAARLVNADADTDRYLIQTIPFPSSERSGGLSVTVSGWYYIDPSVAFTGPAYLERGLYAESQYFEAWMPINFFSPHGSWQRLEMNVGIPPPGFFTFDPVLLSIRLYAPGGAIVWDRVQAKVSAYVGADDPPGDLRYVIENLAGWAAARFDRNITINTPPATGVIEGRQYLTEDDDNVWQALSEYPRRGICDFEVYVNPNGSSREFVTHVPRRGIAQSDLALELGKNILDDWTFDSDSTEVANQVHGLGRGSGVNREFEIAEDLGNLDGAMILQKVVTADSRAPLSALRPMAQEELARAKQPVRTPTLPCRADGLFGALAVGDTVPVRMRHGWVNVNEEMRVMAMTLRPPVEVLDVTVANP